MVVNTAVAQTRAVLAAVITLVSLPILLAQLGPHDFGLYNLIGGAIALLAFMRNALANSAQRHISLALGARSSKKFRVALANAIAVHFALGAAIAVVGLAAGAWYVRHGLNADSGQKAAAIYVWVALLLTVIFNLLSVPFFGVLQALERMTLVAALEILTSVGTLVAAVALHWLPGSKIVWYASLVALVNGLVTLGAVAVGVRAEPRARDVPVTLVQRELIHELLGFAGWNLFGTLATAGRLQGLAIVLNWFFGTTANAAFGVASRLGAFHLTLTASIQRATFPRLMREEGANRRERSLRLAEAVGRCALLASCLWCIPFIAEAKFLLGHWLPTAPRDAVAMSGVLLAALTLDTATVGLSGLVQAIGRIARFQIYVGATILLAVPLAAVGFWLGAPPSFAVWSTLITTAAAGYVRAWLAVPLAGLEMKGWMRRTVWRSALAGLLPVAITCGVTLLMEPSWPRVAVNLVITTAATIAAVFAVGVEPDERKVLLARLAHWRSRVRRRPEEAA